MARTFTDFFGFLEDPFKRTPDVDFYYLSRTHQEALYTLNYLVQSEEGFAVLVGAPGTGKSITVRRFINELSNNVVFAYILFPNLKPEELFQAILEDFGIQVGNNVSKNSLFSKLQELLLTMKEAGKQVLIIVDEAQNIPYETLEELRILSNLETEKEKLLKIVLAGQPELEDKLNSSSLRQLKQRITLFAHLRNLTKAEVADYVNFRLERAGRRSVVIQRQVFNSLYTYSKGNPRLINALMERSIIAAFLDSSHTIKSKHFKSALGSISTTLENPNNKINSWKVLAISLIAVLVVISVVGYSKIIIPINAVISKSLQKKEVVASNNVDTSSKTTAIPVVTPPPTPINRPSNNVAVITENVTVNDNNTDIDNATVVAVIPEPIVADNDTAADNATVVATVGESDNSEPVATTAVTTTNEVDFATQSMPVGTKAVVTVGSLNVRAEPQLDSSKVASLSYGKEIVVIEESLYWVKINLDDNRPGWAFKQFLRKVE